MMTIIISCITRDHVIQVSDRRFGVQKGTKYIISDDFANKAVVYKKQMSFGFSGIGAYNSLRLDEWLADILDKQKPQNIMEAVSIISKEASELFKKFRLPRKDKRHSFVGIGWAHKGSTKRLWPFIVTISNAENIRGDWLSEASDAFKPRIRFLSNSKTILLCVTGQHLLYESIESIANPHNRSMEEQTKLELTIKATLRQTPEILHIADLLVAKIRCAAACNTRIGDNVMVVSLPRRFFSAKTSTLAKCLFANSPPEEDMPSFFYVDKEGIGKEQYSPIIVDEGSKVTFKAEFGQDAVDDLLRTAHVPDVLSEWTIILTEVVEVKVTEGPFAGTQRIPEIKRDYPNLEFTFISASQLNPFEFPPAMVGIKADDETLDKIREDNRFFVLSEIGYADSIPVVEWLQRLKEWLIVREFNPAFLSGVMRNISGISHRQIVESLKPILKMPKMQIR